MAIQSQMKQLALHLPAAIDELIDLLFTLFDIRITKLHLFFSFFHFGAQLAYDLKLLDITVNDRVVYFVNMLHCYSRHSDYDTNGKDEDNAEAD